MPVLNLILLLTLILAYLPNPVPRAVDWGCCTAIIKFALFKVQVGIVPE